MALPTPSIPRPEPSIIFAQLDGIQSRYEQEFQTAYKNVNRMRAKTFWDSGFDAGVEATLNGIRTGALPLSMIGAIQNSPK